MKIKNNTKTVKAYLKDTSLISSALTALAMEIEHINDWKAIYVEDNDNDGFFIIKSERTGSQETNDTCITDAIPNSALGVIEEVAAMHEDIIEVAAVGVPHEATGEMVKLFAVRKNDSLTDKMLIW